MSMIETGREKELYCSAFSSIQVSEDFARRVKLHMAENAGGRTKVQLHIRRRRLVQFAAVAAIVLVLAGIGQIPSVQAAVNSIYDRFFLHVTGVYEENVNEHMQKLNQTIHLKNGQTITFKDCVLTDQGVDIRYFISDRTVDILDLILEDDQGNTFCSQGGGGVYLQPESEATDIINTFFLSENDVDGTVEPDTGHPMDMSFFLNKTWTLAANVYVSEGESFEVEYFEIGDITFESLYEAENLFNDVQSVVTENGEIRICQVTQNTYYTEIIYACAEIDGDMGVGPIFKVYDETGVEYAALGGFGNAYTKDGIEYSAWDIEQIPDGIRQLVLVPYVLTNDAELIPYAKDSKGEPVKIILDLK